MLDSPTAPALIKIALTFAFMLFALHRHWRLWLVILLGGLMLGLLFGLHPAALGALILKSLFSPSTFALFAVVACIMTLSSVQGKTGQGRRLVAGLTPYMRSPRLRLAFFPAMVGLLAVPGGAIFSCPMIRDVATGFDLPSRRLVLINYWFRHIWESAWPLYPGYIMACILADIPPSQLWRYTFPIVISSCFVGWLFFLRAPVPPLAAVTEQAAPPKPLHIVLCDALPVVVGIGMAPVISAIFDACAITAPDGAAFALSFLLAVVTAMVQDKVSPAILPRLMATPHVGNMLALVLVVFVFKDIVLEAKVAESLADAGKGALLLLMLVIPILMGALTGIMLGFVGAALPLLLALVDQAGFYSERLCWVIFALSAGHFGQMVSPMHSCYLVTLEFFREHFIDTWLPVFAASVLQLSLCAAYIFGLYVFVRPIFP